MADMRSSGVAPQGKAGADTIADDGATAVKAAPAASNTIVTVAGRVTVSCSASRPIGETESADVAGARVSDSVSSEPACGSSPPPGAGSTPRSSTWLLLKAKPTNPAAPGRTA